MPTARELLEQADALMRRNRVAALDDIPVLTDSVPMSGDRVPPPHGPDAPVPAAPPAAGAPRAPAAAGIPTLTERAPPGGPHEPPDSMLQEGGEPSDWLDIEGGEPSVVGEAPDSVAIVPPVEHVRVSDEALLMAAEHEEIELTTPAEDAFDDEFAPRESPRDVAPEPHEEIRDADLPAAAWAAARESVPMAPVALEAVAEAAPAPTAEAEGAPRAVADAPPGAQADDAPEAAARAEPAAQTITPLPPKFLPEVEPAAMPGMAGPDAESIAAASTFAAPVPAETAVGASWLPEPPAAGAAMPPSAHPVIAEPEPAAPAASAADDQAKWDAIAEEVRVQVLQRIDLFTDTGLRDQLGQRLKPIVDRASADLIATISLNLGELLRAYVAEAIEREIESWRRSH